MPGNNVNLIPVQAGGNFSQWNMSLNGGGTNGPQSYPQIPVTGSNATITFTIVNPKGIQFDTANPIYVKAGTAKPGTTLDSQFTAAVTADQHGNPNAVLTVTDSNSTAGSYAYVLNFQNSIPQVDPIMNNGGPGGRNYDYIWYAVGAVALIVILVLILRPMFNKQRQ